MCSSSAPSRATIGCSSIRESLVDYSCKQTPWPGCCAVDVKLPAEKCVRKAACSQIITCGHMLQTAWQCHAPESLQQESCKSHQCLSVGGDVSSSTSWALQGKYHVEFDDGESHSLSLDEEAWRMAGLKDEAEAAANAGLVAIKRWDVLHTPAGGHPSAAAI